MASEKRITVGVLRGTPKYKREIQRRIRNIKIIHGKDLPLEHIIEEGINHVFKLYGEDPVTGRLPGRPLKTL